MKEFTWTGKKEGVVVRGSLESESLDDAIAILKGRGIEVEELVEFVPQVPTSDMPERTCLPLFVTVVSNQLVLGTCC